MTCVPTCRYDGMLDASAGGCLRHMRCTKGDIYTSFSSTHQCWLRRRYQNDLKRIHRASVTCKVQTKQVQYPESITENTPQQKKTSTAKKAPLQKYHTWNSDSKSFLTLFFGGLPIPSPFHVEHSRGTFTCERPLFNSQPQEVQVSPLKQFVAGRRLAHHLVHVPFDKAVPVRRQE